MKINSSPSKKYVQLAFEIEDAPLSNSRVNWWWMSFVTGTAALGIASVAVANAKSRSGFGYTGSSYYFWFGILMILIPISFRLLMKNVDRRERLTLVVLLGASLYLVKYLGSPTAFTFSDEYIHLRNTQEILRTHRLFAYNPLLPTASYYPGLGAVTAGLVDLTGLSIFASGLIVIGLARLLFSACFFFIAERTTKSGRAAAAASLIYAANPMFIFWSAAFSYENLALPLAAFAIWWLGRTRQIWSEVPLIVAVISILAVTVTHHVVGFALSVLLITWWLVERLARRPTRPRRIIGSMALLSTTTTLVWFFIVARPAPSYLFTNNLLPAIRQTISLVLGHISPRHLYVSGGFVTPQWETIAGFAAVGVLLLLLPSAAYLAWRQRDHPPMIIAAGVALLFPLSLLPRLATDGVAISGRSSEYVFAGLGCVLGLLAIDRVQRARHAFERPKKVRWKKTVIATLVVTVVFVGETTVGQPFYEQLSETSHPHGFPWTVQPDAIIASKWAYKHLGSNQRFGSDALDSFALATYGEQYPVNEDEVWPIFFAKTLSAKVVRDIRSAHIRYLLVNWQMTHSVPPSPGSYFSPDEPGAGNYKNAFPAAALKKFGTTSCVGLVYHRGAFDIYDLALIENGSCLPQSTSSATAETPG